MVRLPVGCGGGGLDSYGSVDQRATIRIEDGFEGPYCTKSGS
jgi:hypothetical protein